MWALLPIVCIVVLVAGCSGKVDYVRPSSSRTASNSTIIEKSRDTVWNTSVAELGKQFFVINNLDKASGLINISYTGDPESYIDCGRFTSYVKNVRGERTYDFPGARAQQTYEIMYSGSLFYVERKMSLEGRVNLVFEDIDTNRTKMTANTRYVVTRQVTQREVTSKIPQSRTDTISFNSGGSASFQANVMTGQPTVCASTGKLEHDILSFIK